MNDLADIAANYSPTVVLGLIFWKVMTAAFAFHVQSLAEQRKDLVDHMKTTCEARGPRILPAALLALLLLAAPGCTSGQGGSVGDFSLQTPIGSFTFRTWTVTPANTAPTTRPIN